MSTMKGRSGLIDVSLPDYKDMVDAVRFDYAAASKKVIQRTINEASTRVPPWIAKAVTAHYGISKADVRGAMSGARKIGSIKVTGISVDNIALTYQGRLLTPVHFKMKRTPSSKSTQDKFQRVPGGGVAFNGIPGSVAMVKQPVPYQVTAMIIKGSRKVLHSEAFLAPVKKGSDMLIPFIRTGDSRTAMKSIRTVAIPEMIENKDVYKDIQANIEEGLNKRLQHHLQQAINQIDG